MRRGEGVRVISAVVGTCETTGKDPGKTVKVDIDVITVGLGVTKC